MTVEEFEQIKNQIVKLQRSADRIDGALQEILKTLKDKFGCKTIEEAIVLLKEFKEHELNSERKLRKKELDFQKKWKDTLRELENES